MARRQAAPARPGARSEQVEGKLAARHITFKFVPELPVTDIRDAEGNQVRAIERRAPKEMVTRYAEQMKAGAVFPAVVVNERLELVDGNTRRSAATKIGLTAIAAYVCDDLSALQARSLSVELNQMHGLAMSEDEIRSFVASAVAEGQVLDTRAYARMTGISASTLRRWVAASQCRIRAANDGLPTAELDALREGVQAALNVAHLRSVFADVASLASAANLPAAEVRQLITRANDAPSEAEARSIISSEREARRDEIAAIAAGFKRAKQRRGRTAVLNMAGLLKLEVDDLLDVEPDRQAEHLDKLRATRNHLSSAIERAESEWQLADDASVADPEVSASEPEKVAMLTGAVERG